MPLNLPKLAFGKAAWLGIGAVVTLVGLLSAGLAYQTHQVGQWRDAARILNEALATELAQTAHLRTRIDAQNARIDALAAEARQAEASARQRAREVQQRRRTAIAESETLEAGPDVLNAWLQEAFPW